MSEIMVGLILEPIFCLIYGNYMPNRPNTKPNIIISVNVIKIGS